MIIFLQQYGNVIYFLGGCVFGGVAVLFFKKPKPSKNENDW